MIFNIINFGSYYMHVHRNIGSIRGTADNLSATFKSGLYLIECEPDAGICGLVTYIADANINNSIVLEPCEIQINGEITNINNIRKTTCYIGEYKKDYNTRKEVKKVIDKSKDSKHTSDKIMGLFGLDMERFDRMISKSGINSWKNTAALAFTQGKNVYCSPWLSSKAFNNYAAAISYISNAVCVEGGIIIVPVSYKVDYSILTLNCKTIYAKEKFDKETAKTTIEILSEQK